jgi:hypothetical protein
MKVKPIQNVWVVVDKFGDIIFGKYFLSFKKAEKKAKTIQSYLVTVQKVNINFEVVE